MATNIGPKIGVEGEAEYRKSINQIIQQAKTLDAQMRATVSSFNSTTSAEEKAAAKSKILSEQITTQKERIRTLTDMMQKSAAKYGENDARTLKWREAVLNATTALNGMEQELADVNSGLDETSDDFTKAGKGAASFGDVLKANVLSDVIMSGLRKMGGYIKEAGTSFIQLTKDAVNSYSDYEQLVGGVETLFGDSAKIVENYANNAFKTAGLSANEYMETVTSFSASLIQGLGGDTEQAAKLANLAITDMSDNANKMGTDISSIQNAYQGFAKQNYTMLDNLKLGYGGTAAEMARLINDSGVLGDQIDVTAKTVNEVSFDKMIEAIHVVQTELGITGTTSKEASTTIQGSANAMKSAWQNMLTGFADEKSNLSQLTKNLTDSIVTFADNLIPRIMEILPRLTEGFTQLINALVPYVEPTLQTILPALTDGIEALVNGIVAALPVLLGALSDAMPMIIDTVLTILPELMSAGVDFITALVEGIADAAPQLLDAIVRTAIAMVSKLIEKIPDMQNAAVRLMSGLLQGLLGQIPNIIGGVVQIALAIQQKFRELPQAAIGWGRDLIQGFINGILDMWNNLKNTVANVANTISSFLHFSRPDVGPLRNYEKWMPDMMTGLARGIDANAYRVEDALMAATSGMRMQIEGTTGAGATQTTNYGGVNIVVNGAPGQDVNELAEAIMYKIENAYSRKASVFA
jgi:hypothetical protein